MEMLDIYISVILISVIATVATENTAEVVVRAVLISCEPNDGPSVPFDNEAMRFERDELFKHSVLRDCTKKIALTVKIASDPDNSGDEYIPIEHVFQGPKKRVRLLNPYVLRLRREPPLQAYKLRKINTVTCMLSKETTIRNKRNSESSADAISARRQENMEQKNTSREFSQESGSCEITSKSNSCLKKRGEKNVASNIEAAHEIENHSGTNINVNKPMQVYDDSLRELDDSMPERSINLNDIIQSSDEASLDDWEPIINEAVLLKTKKGSKVPQPLQVDTKMEWPEDSPNVGNEMNSKTPKSVKMIQDIVKEYDMYEIGIADLWYTIQVQLFEKLATPDRKSLWNDLTKGNPVRVSSISPEWTDHDISIRYRSSEWVPRNEFTLPVTNMCLLAPMASGLRASSPVKNEHFDNIAAVDIFSGSGPSGDKSVELSFAVSSLILMSTAVIDETSGTKVSHRPPPNSPEAIHTTCNAGRESLRVYKTKELVDKYIVLPREDVVNLPDDTSDTNKQDDSSSREDNTEKANEPTLARVMIRTSRALFGGLGEKVTIVSKGGDRYLTLVHRHPYHAQIDVEARADGNQLVHVGTFGRLMTVVSDNSRQSRTVLTVQATNTGLAAARFRVVARDCNPELQESTNGKEPADSILLPPKHTQSIRLELPTEIPVGVAHCTVALINGDDQSVAVRDVTIKKGDRCFCVWHCECVCLGEDPKLLCREMAEARQIAAGLTPRERTRNVRSVCYPDVVTLNLCIAIVGVLITLLLCGVLKACLGLVFRCVGCWGLHHILQMPRRLDHYYEPSLQECPVVYDEEGWPVHPQTKQRSVRLISKPMEFVLNTIFFITAPCVIIYEVMRELLKRWKNSDGAGYSWNPGNNDKNCFSSHDIQGHKARYRRRRAKLQRWMTPEAEMLSSKLWQKGLPFRASMIKDYMRPLLREEYTCRGDIAVAEPVVVQKSCGDSDVDDTEYVLTQMQKSRESLARSQRILNEPKATSAKDQ